MLFAGLPCFVFLCVSLYQRLSLQFDSVFGGLAAAAIFMVFAALGGVLVALAQRQARERAILEGAAQMRARMQTIAVDAVATEAAKIVSFLRVSLTFLYVFIQP